SVRRRIITASERYSLRRWLIIGANTLTIFKDILCAVDIWEDCTVAIERAVKLAENNEASLTIIDVVDRITAGIGMLEGGPISVELQSKMQASCGNCTS
ncbi:MAG: hypothetical protein KIS75_03365, partial [Chromatiales bacterium]|nr:hypothetical protein [Chromatiales bacterium]